MANFGMIKKFKTIISCVIVAFVFVLVLATVSFVQVGKARRASADNERQIEQLKDKQFSLKDDIEYLESDEGKDESARDQGLLPEGENEIEVK